MSIVETNHLERRQKGVGKERVYIAGTRISVQFIYVDHELLGHSPDEIVAAYPHLTLAQVHAALSYCYDHLDEMRREYQEELAFVEEHRRKQGPGPLAKTLRSRLQAVAAADVEPSSPQVSDEELDRRQQSEDWHTTDDVLSE